MSSRLLNWISSLLRCIIDPRCITAALTVVLLTTAGWQYWLDPWRQFQLGIQSLEKNELTRVQSVADWLATIPTYQPHALYLKAALSLREGKVKEAIEQAIAAKDHPDLVIDANVLAGEAAYKIGAVGNAKLHWEEALRANPECVLAHRWLGVLYYDLGAMDAAMLHLGAVSRLAPDDYRADRLMGLMNRDYERPETAIPHYQESLKRAPTQPNADEVRVEMAECQIKLREFDAALKTLEKCVDTPRKIVLQARCMLNLGSLDEARRLAVGLLSTSDPKLDALQINAEIALADGELRKAADLLTAATKADPYNHGVRTQLSQVLGRLGEADAAREQTQRAEELQKLWQRFSDLQIDAINRPTDANVRYEIGTLADQLGKRELAISWFKASLGIDPNLRVASEALADALQPTTSPAKP